ncbi:hypothetical protein [uncultured Ruminococcus sp.]|uniref:hypothetical protein n=1 Tax=uncultured Ruminococcus sp. TaxID=165186 RepID=UPI0025D1CBE9|nr:hypothetical protein [uncultured Ruminococcus sp.]
MVGEIRKLITPYYDKTGKKQKFKSRPALILQEISGDYVYLPISTITDKSRIDPKYDYQILITKYPNLALTKDSYIRVNKQSVTNRANIADKISDLRIEYPELFSDIVGLIEQCHSELTAGLNSLIV